MTNRASRPQIEGSLNADPSFVNPWSLHEVEHTDVVRRVAQASDDVIRAVAEGFLNS